MKRTVFTIAAGQELYVKYAVNLAYSFLLWNRTDDISFVLVTDRPEFVPNALTAKIDVVRAEERSLGAGFSSKLSLDNLIREGQNLFIDADCLVYSNLQPVFERFAGRFFSLIGHTINEGLDVGFSKNIQELLTKLALPYYPMFCGSVYYMERGKVVSELFAYSRSLLPRYDELGLIRLRQKENEEPLVGLGMAKYSQHPINDDGTIKADRMFYDHCFNNVLTGAAKLKISQKPPKPIYSVLHECTPAIIHFNARFTETYEYKSDEMRLRLVFRFGIGKQLADLLVSHFYATPARTVQALNSAIKESLRPIYRKLLGTRKIKPSNRL